MNEKLSKRMRGQGKARQGEFLENITIAARHTLTNCTELFSAYEICSIAIELRACNQNYHVQTVVKNKLLTDQ